MLDFHKWTNANGEVLILRRISQNRITHNGFVWPSGVGTVVECPDWNPEPICGGGLHGWPWGFGLGDGSDYDIIGDIWLVLGAKPEDVVGELDGGAKCKVRRATIRLEGKFADTMSAVKDGFDACIVASSRKCDKAVSSGDRSKAVSSGDRSKAVSSGDRSTAASSGDGSTAASSGDRSKAVSSGDGCACQTAGRDTLSAISGTGKIRVSERGAFALAYWESDAVGWRFLTGKVGESGVKANTWYEIKDGKIVESV